MRPEVRRMIAEDSRIVGAYDSGMSRCLWSRDWEDLFGYRTGESLDLPPDAWLRYSDPNARQTGVVTLARYLTHGLEDEETEDRHGNA